MKALIAYAMMTGVAVAAPHRNDSGPHYPPTECRTLQEMKDRNASVAKAMAAAQQAMADVAKANGETATDALEKPKTYRPDVFTPMNSAQLHFLMGVYAMNPATPKGLPPGPDVPAATGGLLASVTGHPEVGAVAFWTNKAGKICGNGMPAPKILLDLMKNGNLQDGKDEDKESL
jgi:hypothetical protein